MTFVAVLVGTALLLASVLVVAEPFFRMKRPGSLGSTRSGRDAVSGYQQTLLAIRDLDFDHQLAVLTAADYRQQRALLLTEAAGAYKNENRDSRDLQQVIEAAVLRQRRIDNSGHGRCSNCGADLDPGDKYCVSCGCAAGSSCPQCSQPITKDARFCPNCGAQLVIEEGIVG